MPRSVAGERLERLFALQETVQLELNQSLIGRRVEVLVDGASKRASESWQGRGPDNRVVNFPAWQGIRAGEIERVVVTGATAHALLGVRATGGRSGLEAPEA